MKHLIIVIALTLSAAFSMATCKNASGAIVRSNGALTRDMVSMNSNARLGHGSNTASDSNSADNQK